MSLKSQQEIVEYGLTGEARGGVAIRDLYKGGTDDHDVYSAHRDNHFLLMFAMEGILRIQIDFEEKILSAPALMVISPGQVHHMIKHSALRGWAISFDPTLITEDVRYIFELGLPCPFAIEKKTPLFVQAESLMALISQTLQGNDNGQFALRAVHHLLKALLDFVAIGISQPFPSNKDKNNRGRVIEQEFIRLLRDHYKDWKQPSIYAKELAVSVSHLNDTVKGITGKPVSIHIQHRSILEAKRLLYFSDLSVKEIGYEAGYEDPVYFSKLFRKITGYSPLQFRDKFRG